MKIFKDIYKFPIKVDKSGHWVRDADSKFMFQFDTSPDKLKSCTH